MFLERICDFVNNAAGQFPAVQKWMEYIVFIP